MNYISALLLGAIFSDTLMLRASDVISKLIFWIENIYYIIVMIIQETGLLPIAYIKLILDILKSDNWFNKLQLLLFWIPIGPFFLCGCLFNDMYFFSKILCDYRMENDEKEIKEEEDKEQDKIVIYNEVLDTLRAVLNMLKY